MAFALVVVVDNLSCEQVLHLRASREVLLERHAKGDESVKAGKERSRVLSRLASLVASYQ